MVPWVSSFPLGALLSLVGPYGYLFHNTFGDGLTVEEAVERRGWKGDVENLKKKGKEMLGKAAAAAGGGDDEEEEEELSEEEQKRLKRQELAAMGKKEKKEKEKAEKKKKQKAKQEKVRLWPAACPEMLLRGLSWKVGR